MARFSIIIPYSGNAQWLEDTLVSVLENRPEGCRIIVVLNDVYDDPYDLKDEISFVYAPIGADPIRCINLGIDACAEPVVHVLWPGVEVESGWADAALAHFSDPRVAAVAPLIVEREDPQRVLAGGINVRPGGGVQAVGRGEATSAIGSVGVLGPDLRAAFYRASALDHVGRFAVEFGPEWTGVDAALRLDEIGGVAVLEPQSRVRAARVESKAGTFGHAFRAERLFWRWAPQGGWLGALIAHLGEVVLDVCRVLPGPGSLAVLAGRMAGVTMVAVDRRHLRRCRQRQRESQSTPRAAIAAPHFAAHGPLAEK